MLRDFDEKLLTTHPCEFLRLEDARLESGQRNGTEMPDGMKKSNENKEAYNVESQGCTVPQHTTTREWGGGAVVLVVLLVASRTCWQ